MASLPSGPSPISEDFPRTFSMFYKEGENGKLETADPSSEEKGTLVIQLKEEGVLGASIQSSRFETERKVNRIFIGSIGSENYVAQEECSDLKRFLTFFDVTIKIDSSEFFLIFNEGRVDLIIRRDPTVGTYAGNLCKYPDSSIEAFEFKLEGSDTINFVMKDGELGSLKIENEVFSINKMLFLHELGESCAYYDISVLTQEDQNCIFAIIYARNPIAVFRKSESEEKTCVLLLQYKDNIESPAYSEVLSKYQKLSLDEVKSHIQCK